MPRKMNPNWPRSMPWPRAATVTIKEAMSLWKGKTDKMTKTELIEEVSRAVEMTRRDSEVIVEAIFNLWFALCAMGTRSKSGVLEASARTNGSRV